MRKLEKMARQLNDDFRNHLAREYKTKFGHEIKTEYLFLADRLSTTRVDGDDFTPEQHAWISAFESGYGSALSAVRAADR